MAYKNPEDKKAWRREYKRRYPEKHKAWENTRQLKKYGKTREEIAKDKETERYNKWLTVTMPSEVSEAIQEIKTRILKESKQFICMDCLNVFSLQLKHKRFPRCSNCSREYNRKWIPKRTNEQRNKENKRARDRMKSDIEFKIKSTVRRQIGDAIRNYCKVGYESRTGKIKYLGCTIPELKAFLETKFSKRMTWDNHGNYWHIDHIKPLSLFNVMDESQMMEAFNYQNLQPLKASENFRKGNRWYPEHTQLGLLI
jgi:protein-arginine kinase activator protein McsA